MDKETTCQCERCRRYGLLLWVRKIPWRRKWQPTPVFLPGKPHGQGSLVGYSPWSRKSWTRLSDSSTKSFRPPSSQEDRESLRQGSQGESGLCVPYCLLDTTLSSECYCPVIGIRKGSQRRELGPKATPAGTSEAGISTQTSNAKAYFLLIPPEVSVSLSVVSNSL